MPRHVEHLETGLVGVARSRAERLHPWDPEGPWLSVEWDDGLVCWVPEGEVRDADVSFR